MEPGATVDVDVTPPDGATELALFCKLHGALGQRGAVVVKRS